MAENCPSHEKLVEKVALASASAASAHKRLDNTEKQIEAIIRLSVSVEHLTTEIADIMPVLTSHGSRLNDLEVRPAVNIKNAVVWFLGVVVTVITGAVIGGVIATKIGG